MVLLTSTHALAANSGGFVDVTYKVANVDASYDGGNRSVFSSVLTTILLVTTPLVFLSTHALSYAGVDLKINKVWE